MALFLFPAEQSLSTIRVTGDLSAAQSAHSGPSSADHSSGVLDVLWKTILKSNELVKRYATYFYFFPIIFPCSEIRKRR